MKTFRSIVFTAALAGLSVGIVVSAIQQFGTVPLILRAETYEKAAEAGRPASEPAQSAAAGHQHAPGTPPHDHAVAGHQAWEPREGFERNAYTVLFNIVDWIGFALIVTAALVLMRRPVTWREGLFWGLGGFAAFVLAPTLGLPPELPGVPTADLGPRQLWWVATAVATAAGLALVALRRSPAAAILAVALICAPHLFGAPRLEHVDTNVPDQLSHQFAVAVLLTTFVSWALLGGLTGFFYRRFSA